MESRGLKSKSVVSTKIAFHVQMSRDMSLHNGRAVIFDKELVDSGNAFNPSTGVFVAPVSGYYVFSWTLSFARDNDICIDLTINGQPYQREAGFEHDGTWMYATSLVVSKIHQGDIVVLKTCSNGVYPNLGGVIESNKHRTPSFSGWLIWSVAWQWPVWLMKDTLKPICIFDDICNTLKSYNIIIL